MIDANQDKQCERNNQIVGRLVAKIKKLEKSHNCGTWYLKEWKEILEKK